MRRMVLAISLLAVAGRGLAHGEDMPALVHAVAHGWWLLTLVALLAILLPALRRT